MRVRNPHREPVEADVTRIKSGTCEFFAGAYFSCHALGRKRAETPSHSGGRPSGFERDIRGESRRNQGLRLSSILVITPAQTGEASRVLHPLRSCASECSANGRSATRSDSQRSNGRTRWDGHPAWGSKPRPLPRPPERRISQPVAGREKNGGSDAPTLDSPCVGRPSSHD